MSDTNGGRVVTVMKIDRTRRNPLVKVGTIVFAPKPPDPEPEEPKKAGKAVKKRPPQLYYGKAGGGIIHHPQGRVRIKMRKR